MSGGTLGRRLAAREGECVLHAMCAEMQVHHLGVILSVVSPFIGLYTDTYIMSLSYRSLGSAR